MAQGDVFSCNAAWPRAPERRELSVIKMRSSMPPAAYQRLNANPTIHIQMRFLESTHDCMKKKAKNVAHAGMVSNFKTLQFKAIEEFATNRFPPKHPKHVDFRVAVPLVPPPIF